MPQRHAKNNTDAPHFTHYERQISGHGTLKLRFGSDSQLKFGYCSLSLHPLHDPVATPSGHLYNRETIIEYLLTKSRELKEQKKLFERQQLLEVEKQREQEKNQQLQLLTWFAESETGIGEDTANRKRKRTEVENQDVKNDNNTHANRKKGTDENSIVIAKLKEKHDVTSISEKKQELQRTSFWLADLPQHETKLEMPESRPRSPMSGQPLRMKDLIDVHLTLDPEDEGKNDFEKHYICPISRDQITSQPIVLIKNTGHVILKKVCDELVLPSKVCPLTGKKVKNSDIIELKRPGTSFAASGQVEASKYRPTMR